MVSTTAVVLDQPDSKFWFNISYFYPTTVNLGSGITWGDFSGSNTNTGGDLINLDIDTPTRFQNPTHTYTCIKAGNKKEECSSPVDFLINLPNMT